MASPVEPPLPTPELVARLVTAEQRCMTDWMQAVADLPDNPFGIAIATFGNATALVCSTIPAQVFNRVFGLTVADRDQIETILAFYAQHGAAPVFDLSPYGLPPYWVEPNLFTPLMEHGLYQGAFRQLLYALPSTDISPLPVHLSIRAVEAADADLFAAVYDQVWGGSGAIRVLLGHPRFRCYLAFVDGEPAGLGILHIADGVASMANGLAVPHLRGRGCQTALLHRRLADAAEAGCSLVVSQCAPGSTSQNNQLRVGFRIAGSKAWWLPRPRD